MPRGMGCVFVTHHFIADGILSPLTRLHLLSMGYQGLRSPLTRLLLIFVLPPARQNKISSRVSGERMPRGIGMFATRYSSVGDTLSPLMRLHSIMMRHRGLRSPLTRLRLPPSIILSPLRGVLPFPCKYMEITKTRIFETFQVVFKWEQVYSIR